MSQEAIEPTFVRLAGRTLCAPFSLSDAQTLSCACSVNDLLAVGEVGHMPSIRIINLHAPSIVTDLKKHLHGIRSIALSPFGKYLVSVGQVPDDQIILWDWRKRIILGRARSSKKVLI